MKLDRAGWPFVLLAAAATIGVAIWSLWLATIPALGLVFVLNFFRDPERAVPADPALLLAPACGRIIRADDRRVSIFMNVFDVHVCRSPLAGRVASVERHAGDFVAAYADSASEHNERVTIVVAPDRGAPVSLTLVAGLVARRIVCRVGAGERLAAGQRLGIIRFGSRVDVDLPSGAEAVVKVGDRTVSGETALARRRDASL